jgi:DNA-binding PadR family transcriptional regulator
LLALARSNSHAYPLKAIICNDSLGSVKIPDSKLYLILTKLCDEARIEIIGSKPAGKSGRPRTQYGITHYGLIDLQEELTRLDHAIKIGQAAHLMDNPLPTDLQRMLKSIL